MQRVSLEWFAQLGLDIRPLIKFDEKEKFDFEVEMEMWPALFKLQSLLNGEFHLQLRASQPLIQSLIHSIEKISNNDNKEEAFRYGKYAIKYAASQLLPVLYGELAIQNCYLIAPKRAYDIEFLIQDATKIFSNEVALELSPMEKYDVLQAGRCLAFEIPTAALFHIFRAADSVLRRWFLEVSGENDGSKPRTWRVYIDILRKHNADDKILNTIEQIKNLYRNPVIHPETRVELQDALSFLGIAENLISSIIIDLRRRQNVAASP